MEEQAENIHVTQCENCGGLHFGLVTYDNTLLISCVLCGEVAMRFDYGEKEMYQ